MASVKKTLAQKQLDFALGKARVNLGDLSDSEFVSLLEDTLESVHMRELRGFKALKDFLAMRPGSFICGQQKTHGLGLELLSVGKEASLQVDGFEEASVINWQTHVLQICRGWTRRSFVFKRLETDDETSDPSIALGWQSSGYLFAGKGEILVIRRPRNHARGGKCLLTIRFDFEKVPLKHEHVISVVEVRKVAPDTFQDCFGDRSPRIATELIWELRTACSRTADALETQTKVMREKSAQLDRLGKAIFYS